MVARPGPRTSTEVPAAKCLTPGCPKPPRPDYYTCEEHKNDRHAVPMLSKGGRRDQEERKQLARLVVVESPYAGDIEQNVKYARRAVRDCLERGEAPIASHLLFTQEGILRDDIPAERELGIAASLAWSHKADKLVFYVDYGISSGMHNALKHAEAYVVPYEFRSIGKNES